MYNKNRILNILLFSEVNSEFAYKEGEGHKPLLYWREAHIKFFNRELEMKFSEDMLVVCEEFEVVYK
ncbi:ASCH domain-containing protein [Clostridium frigidicarnis]|uniref:ASCH domain-containing protein n=1 Tax=Clostridium frigidicarnis TaxID=84698 RepID=A0A1I1AIV2_9CLOT|nr:ASCH domain-containing protein [Clostridium frigidicarnis]SFB37945.1 ASCH domain-containing protein [Clostridium frigidicarnis]